MLIPTCGGFIIVCDKTDLSVCLFVCLSLSLCVSLCPCLSVCLCLCMCLCLCLSLSVCLSACRSLLSVQLSSTPLISLSLACSLYKLALANTHHTNKDTHTRTRAARIHGHTHARTDARTHARTHAYTQIHFLGSNVYIHMHV